MQGCGLAHQCSWSESGPKRRRWRVRRATSSGSTAAKQKRLDHPSCAWLLAYRLERTRHLIRPQSEMLMFNRPLHAKRSTYSRNVMRAASCLSSAVTTDSICLWRKSLEKSTISNSLSGCSACNSAYAQSSSKSSSADSGQAVSDFRSVCLITLNSRRRALPLLTNAPMTA